LTDPTGAQFDISSSRVGVRVVVGRFPYLAIQVPHPKPGKWKVEIDASSANSEKASFQLIVGSENSELAITCGTSQKHYQPKEMVRVYIRAFAPMPITGLQISAILISPGSIVRKLRFVDDGTMGDEVANDGVYTQIFEAPAKAGTYRVKAIIKGTKTSTKFAEFDEPHEDSTQGSILKIRTFSRLAETSFVVGNP
jgi:hypothetical protein